MQVVDAPREREHFHDGGLVPRAVAEVGIERCFQLSPSREHGRTKLLQICATLGERRRAVPQKGGALPGEQDTKCLRSRGRPLLSLLTHSGAGDVENDMRVECLHRHRLLLEC